MLELLEKRVAELELELKAQEITPEDEEEIELKVAEYKQKLTDELVSSKAEKSKDISVRLAEVKNLIEEFKALPVEDEILSVEETSEKVEEDVKEEVDDEHRIVLG